ncbi:hypothetical protein AK830_g103 [Neonectria ditissima]|uniref:Uncharacterized protein n=1 Tax=Neonectria ditissima TaxID=78410 RepID=A0A0P7BXZ0_9HYPO|nr:hypothetical protein AK830_g103 [Neonectria ditissima]
MPGDAFFQANPFETGVGHFWGISETRPYMTARYKLVDTLMKNFGGQGGHVDAVQTALDHLLDMLRLCRGDNMGVRDVAPAMFVRLGKDQAAYDFLKWYETTGAEEDYDWGNTELGFLNLKGADVLEPLGDMWSTGYLGFSHAVVVLLLKVRVLLDLQAIQNATRVLHDTVPPEIIQLVRDQLVGSVVGSRSDILNSGPDKIATLIQSIKGQVKQLYKTTNNYNDHFWKWMLKDPAYAIAARPEAYSAKTEEEAFLVIGYTYYAWAETPGAIDMIKSLRKAI